MRRICLMLAILFLLPAHAYGQEPLSLISPSVILIEQSSGKVLYAKNERTRMYPASMTKILTALVVMDYLDPNEVLTIGPEIKSLPAGYNAAVPIHFEGETITVRNLLRALMIRSGNETSQVLAINTIRVSENRHNVTMQDAERRFSALMNEKARLLGAVESHFNNAYGFQSEHHYTTAYDMALIAQEYMRIPELSAIAAQVYYVGDSLEGLTIDGAKVKDYDLETRNWLQLQESSHYYPGSTGLKTGFTNEAGNCLTASATKAGLSLISVVFNTPTEADRFQDSRVLLDYGFYNYAMRTIQKSGDLLTDAVIVNPRLGENNELALLVSEGAEALLKMDELERIHREIIYDEAFLPREEDAFETDETDPRIHLKAPIEKDSQVGVVRYTLDGETLFELPVTAAAEVPERSFDSDMDYYIQQFKDNVFTLKGLPYWFGFFGLLFGIIGVGVAVRIHRNAQNRTVYPRYRGFR